jgi:prevent-host-death family protein
MRSYGIRDLQRRVSEIVREARRSGEPALLTHRGRPFAVIAPIDEDALEDLVFAHVPEYARSLREAEEEFEAGGGVPDSELDELLDAGAS